MLNSMDDETLDALLREPLDPIADDGFSDQIVRQMEVRQKKSRLILGVAFCLAALCLALVLAALLPASAATGVLGWQGAAIALVALLLPLIPIYLIVDS